MGLTLDAADEQYGASNAAHSEQRLVVEAYVAWVEEVTFWVFLMEAIVKIFSCGT